MTSNPMAQNRVYEGVAVSDAPMTIAGTIHKTLTLLLIVVIMASYTWGLVMTGFGDKAMMLFWIGFGVSFVAATITAFKPKYAMPLSILYAFCQGLALGAISASYHNFYEGIVLQAIGATILTLFAMLALYRVGAIRATDRFRAIVMSATFGIMIFYMINLALYFFAPAMLKFSPVWDSGWIGIGFSALVIVIAALYFVIDFDFIEKGAGNLMPKYFEWYGGFMLLVTMIWLYIEMLRLLAKLKNR